MSSDVHTKLDLQTASTASGLPDLIRAAGQLAELFADSGAQLVHPDHPEPLDTIRHALEHALELGLANGHYERIWVTPRGAVTTFSGSGEGRHHRLRETLAILAAAGFTGEVRYEDSDFTPMRLRLADGEVYIGYGHIEYDEDLLLEP